MSDDQTVSLDTLKRHLLPVAPNRLYAMVDTAANQNALDFLYSEASLNFDCLFAGELDPDVFEVAPFLIDLEAQPAVLDWMLAGWGQHWLSFIHSPLALGELQMNLRQFTKVRTPDDRVVWFRFYDPRVMRSALPLLDAAQAGAFFASVHLFLCEGEAPNTICRLSFDGAKTTLSSSKLA